MHKLFLLHSIWINNRKRKRKTFRGIREKNSLFSQRSRSRAWYANVPWVHQRNSRRECFQMLDRDRKVETNRGNYPTEDWNGPQHQDHLFIRRLPMWPQNAREKNRLRRFVLYIFPIPQQTLLVYNEKRLTILSAVVPALSLCHFDNGHTVYIFLYTRYRVIC